MCSLDKSTFFIAGIATGFVGVFVVAKILRPTIKEKAATIAAREVIRFAQANGVPLATLGIGENALKTNLMYPAIDAALNEAFI